jgi:hypothetical protein
VGAVSVEIIATGVLVRPATDDEIRDFGDEFHGVLAVGTPFVDFRQDGERVHWTGTHVHTGVANAAELDDLVKEAKSQRMDLFGDMRIAGLDVTREAYLGAPYRVEVDSELAERPR